MKNIPSNDPSLGAFFGREDLCAEAQERLRSAARDGRLSSGRWRSGPEERQVCALEAMADGYGGETVVHTILEERYNVRPAFASLVSQTYDEYDVRTFVLAFADFLRPGLNTEAIAQEVRMTNKPLLTVMAEHAAKVVSLQDVLAA